MSAFRAFRTELRDAFADYAGAVRLDRRAAALGDDAASLASPSRTTPRDEGRSSYTFGRLATHALNVLTGFSTRPLRIASLVGLAFTLFGVVVLVLVARALRRPRRHACRASRSSRR